MLCTTVKKILILSGQMQTSFPGCRQCPHSLARLAVRGSSKLVVVVGMVVVLPVGEGGGDREGVADGKRQGEGSCDGLPGHGHVVSFERSGKNSPIKIPLPLLRETCG